MKKQSGFTLIEILVVVGVFSGLITLVSGIFLANFELQRKTMAIQKTIGEISYAMEYMGRSIRMARNDLDGSCISDVGYTYDLAQAGDGIRFIDYKNRCTEFYLDETEDVIKKRVYDGEWKEYPLTSGILKVKRFSAHSNILSGEPGLYEKQPSVTLLMEVAAIKEEVAEQVWWETTLQTTVTKRRLDIERIHD